MQDLLGPGRNHPGCTAGFTVSQIVVHLRFASDLAVTFLRRSELHEPLTFLMAVRPETGVGSDTRCCSDSDGDDDGGVHWWYTGGVHQYLTF